MTIVTANGTLRSIFIFALYYKVSDCAGLKSFKGKLFRPGLLKDLFQQINVTRERLLAGGRQGAGRKRTILLVRFTDGDVPRLLQGTDMRGEIAVGHRQRVAQFGE